MPPADPAWRVKSRPCPFYQQGKCFFQENCNFLHDVQVTVDRPVVNNAMHSRYPEDTIPQGPVVQIHSPPNSVRSPRRSPRMSGLLLALKDVIGEVEDEDEDGGVGIGESLGEQQPDMSNSSITLVHSPSAKSLSSSPPTDPAASTATVTEQIIDHFSSRVTPDLLSPVGSEVSNLPSIPFPLRIPSRSSRREDSIDSGYADSWHSPRPLVLSPPRSPALSSTFDILVSPFGTPSARVRGNTPVPVSPLNLTFDERGIAAPPQNSDDVDSDLDLSPDRASFDDNVDDTDLDSEESSPDRQFSTMEEETMALSTSFKPVTEASIEDVSGHPSPQTETLSAAERSWDLSENNSTAIFSPQATVEDEDIAQDVRRSLDIVKPIEFLSAGSTSFSPEDALLDSSPLSSPAKQSVTSEREGVSTPPTPDLIPPNSASLSELSSASECVSEDHIQDDDDTGSIFSATARLAYMTSPELSTSPAVDDDTIYSLYDVYSVMSSPKTSPSSPVPSLSQLSRPPHSVTDIPTGIEPVLSVGSPSSTTSRKSRSTDKTPTKTTFELQRQRVFTPPPIPSSSMTRVRLGTVTHTVTIDPERTSSVSPMPPAESLPDLAFASPPSPLQPLRNSTTNEYSSVEVSPKSYRPYSTTPRSLQVSDSTGSIRNPIVSWPDRALTQYPEFSLPGMSGKRENLVTSPDIGDKVEMPFTTNHSSAMAAAATLASQNNSLSSDFSNLSEDGEPPPPHHAGSSSASNKAESSSAGQSRRSFLKPLRLSTTSDISSISRSSYIIPASTMSPSTPLHTLSSAPSFISSFKRSSVASASVSSRSRNSSISSKRTSYIPSHSVNTIASQCHDDFNDTLSTLELSNNRTSTYDPTLHRQSTLASRSRLSHAFSRPSKDLSLHYRINSNFSELTASHDLDGDPTLTEENAFTITTIEDEQICRPLPTPNTAPPTRPPSIMDSPHAVATPSPNLIFAIASDDVDQVRRVLERGDANPNEHLGPQSALAFTVTNHALDNKLAMVKTLLAFGADPKGLEEEVRKVGSRRSSTDESGSSRDFESTPNEAAGLDGLDPASRYYIKRAGAPHTRQTSALIFRSFFRPLTKVRYEMVGQDRALEQLFKVLSIHSKRLSVAPIVVLLCGPSGHGKSLLARRFGTLLDVPTHTVNMTTVRSTLDLWRSFSMSPYEEPSTSTLAEFLVENEGKRCVVVLDEIEKTEDPKTLHSLLMPWELGRCSFEAGSRHIDVRNVIWLGTSNIGQDLVFDHQEAREAPDSLMGREEYTQLMAMIRPRVLEQLGTSILSRVTTVLPFIPFTLDEKMAIASEALHALAGDFLKSISDESLQSIIKEAMDRYLPSEGARSLYRAVSELLLDAI